MRYKETIEDLSKLIPGEIYRLVWNKADINWIVKFNEIEIFEDRSHFKGEYKFTPIIINDRKGNQAIIGNQEVWVMLDDNLYFEDLEPDKNNINDDNAYI